MAQTPPPDRPRSQNAQKRRDAGALQGGPQAEGAAGTLYCPTCTREISDPLTCGDCSAVICRLCGTPLELADDLAMG